MKKVICLFILLSFYTKNFAQTDDFSKPDYAAIEKNVANKKSPYFYKTLFDRYTLADSTMTIEEKRHLYYGYSFQDEYSPYASSDAEDELREILMKDEAEADDFNKIIILTDKIQQQYPFSLRIKEYRVYCFKELGHTEAASKEYAQAAIIIDAILSSGEGTSKENCFYVIKASNEYEIINLLGFEFGGKQSLIEHRYDHLTVLENPYGIEGFYFDVSRSLSSLKF